MLTPDQQARLDRKCLAVCLAALNLFEGRLKQADPEDSAAIIADLIKANLAQPPAQTDPNLALQAVVSRLLATE